MTYEELLIKKIEFDSFQKKQNVIVKDLHPILAEFVRGRAWEEGHSSGYYEILNIAKSITYELKAVNELLKEKTSEQVHEG